MLETTFFFVYLTGDDFTEFVLLLVLADEVGQAHHHQAHDGGEDAHPLAGLQPASQEGHRQQACEDDDRSAQHLEAGGARHAERWGGTAMEKSVFFL